MPADAGQPIVFRDATDPPLSRLRRTVVISPPRGYAGELVLRNGEHRELERGPADGAPWERELEEGMYQIAPGDGVGFAPTEFRVLAKDCRVDL
jgi:hypothetical protein